MNERNGTVRERVREHYATENAFGQAREQCVLSCLAEIFGLDNTSSRSVRRSRTSANLKISPAVFRPSSRSPQAERFSLYKGQRNRNISPNGTVMRAFVN